MELLMRTTDALSSSSDCGIIRSGKSPFRLVPQSEGLHSDFDNRQKRISDSSLKIPMLYVRACCRAF
jgi:hypothetical protein